MDYILRKFKYKQKHLGTTPKMVITSPKSVESCNSAKMDLELEERTPNEYSNRYELESNQSQETDRNSGDKHNCVINSNNIRRQSHHSSHYSLNSSPSRSSDSSDGRKRFDSSAITQMLLSRPVIVRRNCFDEDLIRLNDNSFAIDCLYWHNVFRAKHGSPPLTLSYSLIHMAQEWANYLAHTDSYKYRNSEGVGENLMSKWTCHPEFDPPGESIVRFWYSEIALYNYSIDPSILHTLGNHFTQVVWKSTEEFGIGKAHTRGGKLIVVANYRPAGNIIDQFHENVLPKLKRTEDRATDRKKSYNTEDLYSLDEQSINNQSLLNH